jgi:hypothetical protein
MIQQQQQQIPPKDDQKIGRALHSRRAPTDGVGALGLTSNKEGYDGRFAIWMGDAMPRTITAALLALSR